MLKVPPRAISANMVLRVLLCNCFLALAAAGPADQPVRIVVLGDSLVAGFGLAPAQAFPAQLERALRARGHAVGFGVGLAKGPATVGRIGYEGRHDYTAIGNVVNLASRICAAAEDGQILIDATTAAEVGDAFALAPLGTLSRASSMNAS